MIRKPRRLDSGTVLGSLARAFVFGCPELEGLSAMTGVELHGIIYEVGGWAETIRSLLCGFRENGVTVALRIVPMNFPKIPLPQDFLAAADDALRTPADPSFPIIQYTEAPFFNPVPGRYVIGFSMLECDRINQTWVDGCNRVQEVWVPSHFNLQTYTLSGAKRVRVMPLGVDAERFKPGLEPVDLPREASFKFLTFDWWLRKGPDLLLHAYYQAFDKHDDVLLIYKIYPFSRDEAGAAIRQISEAYGGLDNTPPVLLIDTLYSWDDIPRLFNSVDCFVLPTRGEGWANPVIEAMACGLPVICTNWSGPTEFINAENSYLLRVDGLEPVPGFADNEICRQGANWARPSLAHLKELMRHVYEHRDEARARGEVARSHVVENYTWVKSTLRMANRLREIMEG